MKGIIGHISWGSNSLLLETRIYLFCFGEKCMSGKVKNFQKLKSSNEFEAEVNFIEPDFFMIDAVVNNHFTIREASKVLGEGIVKEVI